MIDRLLDFSVRARWVVVFADGDRRGATASARSRSCRSTRCPTSPTSRSRSTPSAPNLGPEEVEKRVTFPIETALSGLAGVESTRSFSRNGFSQVTAIFDESADLYFMRQQVTERLAQAKPNLPEGVEPQMGPVSTGSARSSCTPSSTSIPDGKGAPVDDGEPGWQSDGSFLTDEGERLTDDVARLAYLRTVQDWIIRPQLRVVPGVADIDSLGGYEKQYVVEPDPERARRVRHLVSRPGERARGRATSPSAPTTSSAPASLPRARRRAHPLDRRDRARGRRDARRRSGHRARRRRRPHRRRAAHAAPRARTATRSSSARR